jgi:hypothetical protein
MAESARLIIEVTAGVVPGTVEPEHTRQYAVTSAQWAAAEKDGNGVEVLADVAGRAQGYAGLLMLQPDRLNWVRVDWLWL